MTKEITMDWETYIKEKNDEFEKGFNIGWGTAINKAKLVFEIKLISPEDLSNPSVSLEEFKEYIKEVEKHSLQLLRECYKREKKDD